MPKSRYTISTKGSVTVVRRIGPTYYPLIRGISPGSIEKNGPPQPPKSASRGRTKRKKRR
jgi:hypothetical protein